MAEDAGGVKAACDDICQLSDFCDGRLGAEATGKDYAVSMDRRVGKDAGCAWRCGSGKLKRAARFGDRRLL
jgi:hypothetical protein